MGIAERSWPACGFVLAYFGSWVFLRYHLLARSIASGLVWIGILCLLYLLFVLRLMPRAPWNSRPFVLCLLLVAVFSRVVLFDVPPETLSDDVYRYVWDGKVQWHGINPYRFAPAAEELTPLQEPFHAKINHPFQQTIYPPVAQLLFVLAYLLAGSHLWGLRLVYLAFDLLAAWWVFQTIKTKEASGPGFRVPRLRAEASDKESSGLRAGLCFPEGSDGADSTDCPVSGLGGTVRARGGAVFIYLLSPLLVIETYVGMHVDVAGMALLVGAYRYVVARAPCRACTLLVLAVLVKYIALAAVPVFVGLLIRDRWSAGPGAAALDLARWGGWSLLVAAALFAPYVLAGADMFRSLLDYSLYMDFNSPLHSALVHLLKSHAPILRIVVFLGLMGYILSARGSAPVKVGWAIMGLVLTGPAVFPWYLLYLVPFVALEWTLGGLALTTLPFLSYVVLIDFHASGVWRESQWVRYVEYLPVLGCLAFDVWRRRCIGERR